MTLVLNEEQVMLRDSARSFLSERAGVSQLRALRDSGNEEGFSRDLWAEIVEMGWPAVLVPEDYGGLGYGFTGIGLILEECGRTLTPTPLLSSAMVGAAAINRAGSDAQRQTLLPGIASGEQLLALAVDEDVTHRPAHCATTVRRSDDGLTIGGSKTMVVDGHIANTLIVTASDAESGGKRLLLVPADAHGVEVEPIRLLDTHRAARIRLNDVTVPESSQLGAPGNAADLEDYLLDVARIGQSAELLGLAQVVFERTMAYLRERKQFGVPIGAFQALQHRAARLYSEIEMCVSALRHALATLDSDSDEIAAIASLTKAKLSETAHLAATEGIQMHGGIGMTDEYDIGFFLKRCRILETVFGDRYFHLDRYARENGY